MYIDQNKLPAKQVVSKIVFVNPGGEVLIANAAYKPGWVLIGGMNEAGESPVVAAIRETKEEIGLQIDASRLSLTMLHYTAAKNSNFEHLHVVFTTTFSEQEIAAIKLAPHELRDHIFIAKNDLRNYSPGACAKALVDMWRQGNQCGYAENGHFIAPISG